MDNGSSGRLQVVKISPGQLVKTHCGRTGRRNRPADLPSEKTLPMRDLEPASGGAVRRRGRVYPRL